MAKKPRLGRSERQLRRRQHRAYRAVKSAVIADNLSGPKPERSFFPSESIIAGIAGMTHSGFVPNRKLRAVERHEVAGSTKRPKAGVKPFAQAKPNWLQYKEPKI